eukprot:768450-Hanusia_phi.AAC.8
MSSSTCRTTASSSGPRTRPRTPIISDPADSVTRTAERLAARRGRPGRAGTESDHCNGFVTVNPKIHNGYCNGVMTLRIVAIMISMVRKREGEGKVMGRRQGESRAEQQRQGEVGGWRTEGKGRDERGLLVGGCGKTGHGRGVENGRSQTGQVKERWFREQRKEIKTARRGRQIRE